MIRMTGPHASRVRRNGNSIPTWHVAVVDGEEKPQATVYRVLNYRRAVSLSCNMARDRRLFLHMDALPC